MAYLLVKKLKGRKYFYLATNVRLNGKWKRFQVYIGRVKPRGSEIKKYSVPLQQRVNSYLRATDPLFGLLSEKEMKELEELKVRYKKDFRKLPPEVKQKHEEDFLTKFTHDTNAIEGSTLTPAETSLILFEKVVPPGKTLREIKEVENHAEAFAFLTKYTHDVDKALICGVHRILAKDILPTDRLGFFRKVQVWIVGAPFVPPKPELVETEFKKLMNWYRKGKRRYHPVVVATYVHAGFETIHPFTDFNGRAGRLLLNFILMKNGYPAINIKNKDKLKYFVALESARRGDLKPFVNLIVRYIKERVSS